MQLQCDICSKHIELNEPHHTVNFHKERFNGRSITVDYAETILTTCIQCGKNINKNAVARVLSNPSADKARLLGELFIPMAVN